MGMDVNGWVEIRRIPHFHAWEGAIRLGAFSLRNYDMMSSLFGVRPFAPFTPVAPARGIPSDVSEAATQDYLGWDDVSDESWITWSEIESADWSEAVLDSRPHLYERVEGALVYRSKAAANNGEDVTEGATWTDGDSVYRVERISRRQALEDSRDWRLLFRMMGNMAEEYGGDQVRLVVWFDC